MTETPEYPKPQYLQTLENLDVPSDRTEAVEKLELFIIRGRLQDARKYWRAMFQIFNTPENREDPEYFREVHLRVARLLLDSAQLDFARVLLNDVPSNMRSGKQHEALRELFLHLTAASRREAVFPLSVSFERRWQGPHLVPEVDAKGQNLNTWYSGRIEAIEDGVAYLKVGLFQKDHPEGPKPVFGRLEVSLETLETWLKDCSVAELEVGSFLEIATYGTTTTDPVARLHQSTWDGHDDLPPVRIDTNRYLRAAGWVRDGQTFVERAVRGEVGLDEIDDYVGAWHDGDSLLSLADYLGMLPEEYARWVEEPGFLKSIVAKRREVWKREGRG